MRRVESLEAESGKETINDAGRRCATVADPLGVQRPARSNIETPSW